ncbi:MAG: Uma2 family endonuclease [Actinomycetota bacterium]|nr:Uma2 family endonuclease [Actinomycetota bacterium]
MRTVVLGPQPEVQALIERRRTLGTDLFDEVWGGTYHMAPAPNSAHAYLDDVLAVLLHPYAEAAGLVGTGPFNLGQPDDYRVPDRGYHRGRPTGTWVPTAAVVVEIVSPDDETHATFGFYARHAVDEILVADPSIAEIHVWSRRADHTYEAVPASALLSVAAEELVDAITWPDAD